MIDDLGRQSNTAIRAHRRLFLSPRFTSLSLWRILAQGLVVSVAMAFGVSTDAAIIQVGNITGATVTTNGTSGNWTASFGLSTGGSVEVTPYAPDVVRVNFHWTGPFATEEIMIDKSFENWANAGATLVDQGSTYLIQTSQLDVEIEKTPFKVHFKDKSGYDLLRDDFTEYNDAYSYTGQSGDTTSKLKCRKVVPSNQAFFGLGEYGGPMNRRGRTLECWNTGTYNWGEFTNPTYLNIPFFYGVQPADSGNPAYVYGLFFHNPCRPKFRFGTEASDRCSFQAGDGRMDYFFFGGGTEHSMAGVIDRYSELIGRPAKLPKWGLGYHLSRFSYSNQGWVEYIANQATLEDIPLDAVYLDIDYMDADGNDNPLDGNLRQLTMNGNFPTPSGMIETCHNRGVKVIPLIEPWLVPGDTLHTEANGNLHFIKDNGGSTITRNIYVGQVSWFDYSSTAMQDWWRGKIVSWMGSVDFDGIWNDLTEPEGGDQIPSDALLWQDGKYGDQNDSRRHWSNERNYFGLRCSQQSYHTMLEKDPNLRPFILGRSGNAGLQRYAVSWSGDTAANFFYHEKTIRFGMGAMIAGVAWYGNDVGGFAGSPSGELMVRSTEANFLTPFFRNHGDKNSANREPWRFNSTDAGHQRDLIKLRYRLMPYLYTLAHEATLTGEPMNVPAVFDYYEDSNTHNISDYEYLVGDYIYCAPVLSSGASSRSVYLPYAPGVEWYYWPSAKPSGDKYAGGQTVSVSAPLGDCPLFVRSGAIIPMGPAMQHMNEFQANWMDVHCWAEGDSEFTLHEDDGETWDYLSGEYARARMVSQRTPQDWTFTIEARQGTYDPGFRDYYIYLHNPRTNDVAGVTLNGSPLAELTDFSSASEGWLFTGDGRLGVKVPDTGAEVALRVNFQPGIDRMQFVTGADSVSETNGSLRVFVSRVGMATGLVSVTCATMDQSATAGSDFTATTSTLTWTTGDLADKFMDIPVTDDAQFEGDETFAVQLSNPADAAIGSPGTMTVTLLENDPVPPDLVITNPAVDLVVGDVITSYDLQGLANAFNWSGLTWSNHLTGATGTTAIDFAWTIPGVGLDLGTNVITVTATNAGGVQASDDGSDTAYDSGWADGSNGGQGWAAWNLVDGASSGSFQADGSHANNDAGTRAWGLWGNGGDGSDAYRDLSSPMAVGQTFAFRFDNNFIETGGSIGFGLQNATGVNLFEFLFVGGETTYTINDSVVGRDSGIDWSGSGWDIQFELTSASAYRFTCGTNEITGSLAADPDPAIARFHTWNFNAGIGGGFDYFFNDLAVTGGSGASTSVVARIIRGTASQIPQEWRDTYNLVGPNSGDGEDFDMDGLTNYEEWLADSNPTNSASNFGVLGGTFIATSGSGEISEVEILAPTTNSRVYDIWFSSNLVENTWWPIGYNRPGPNDGSGLTFTITNSTDSALFYRGSVSPSEKIGQQANLITRFHGVTGTATIVNGNTIVIEDFTYDGTGVNVQAVVSPNAGYSPYTSISANLLQPGGYSNDTLTLTLPPGLDLEDIGYISIWCVPVGVSFGDGVFE